jgi:hypothetical protein
MHPVTYKGLHKWFKKSFEKLGWMILAMKYDNPCKVKIYLQSLDHLKQSIQMKMNQVEEQDRKMDLGVLLEQTNYLIEFAQMNFSAAMSTMCFGSRRKV